MSEKLNIAVPYYEAPLMLKIQLENWNRFIPDCIEVYIVDDGSVNFPVHNIIRDFDNRFQLNVRRIEKNIPWNHAAARNLLMDMVDDSWTLLTDIDHVLYDFSQNLQNLEKRTVYRPTRFEFNGNKSPILLPHHADSYVITKSTFWRVGGYDETFTGYWNGAFEPFRKALKRTAHIEDACDVYLMRYDNQVVPDANVIEWGRAHSKYDIRTNPELKRKQRAAMTNYKPKVLQCEWLKRK